MGEGIKNIHNAINNLLEETENRDKIDLLDEYGLKLGKAIRYELEQQGLTPNLGVFLSRYGIVRSCHRQTCIVQSGVNQFKIIHCPGVHYCRCAKDVKLGNLLCRLDLAVIKGFEPGLEEQVTRSMKLGSSDYWFESEITLKEGFST
jgi:hypothetical protein